MVVITFSRQRDSTWSTTHSPIMDLLNVAGIQHYANSIFIFALGTNYAEVHSPLTQKAFYQSALLIKNGNVSIKKSVQTHHNIYKNVSRKKRNMLIL